MKYRVVRCGRKDGKVLGVISGSCRAGNGYSDRVSATVSVPHLVNGLELVSTAVILDEGPATGTNSVSVADFRFSLSFNGHSPGEPGLAGVY